MSDPVEDDVPAGYNAVIGEFEAWWQDENGTEQRRSYRSAAGRPSGATQYWQLPSDLPPRTVISWRVRADDGQLQSPWSQADAGGAGCEFIIDDVSPEKPTVVSAEYPEDVSWSDGVGVYGTFRFHSPSEDVVDYTYRFLDGASGTVKAGPDGSAEVRYLPTTYGPVQLEVYANDRSGRRSGAVVYTFYVKAGRSPIGQWALSDPAGARWAEPTAGTAARAGAGVTFGGPAPSGTPLTATATLDGTGHGFLTPGEPVVDTGKTFAVGGWARPAALDHDMTLASQDAGTATGFTLGVRTAGGEPVWSFGTGGEQVSGARPEVGEWAYVLGVYDAETSKAHLYVNGQEAGTPAAVTPSAATGDFQIGRARGTAGYRDRWQGEIGDVRAYDRVVVPEEAAELARRAPKERGHWALEEAADGLSPDAHGGAPLKLAPGASIYTRPAESCDPAADPDCDPLSGGPDALVGSGHLDLDGVGGYAATDGPAVDTRDSFTVGALVRFADQEPAHPMTVLSQGGDHADAFKVRYVPATHTFELVMDHADAEAADRTAVSHRGTPSGNGNRIAVVYDAGLDRITLYVDGIAADTAFRSSWTSTGGLQIGRGHTADGWGEYLRGAVDEVQVFSGALSEGDVGLLGWGNDTCYTCGA
ncbi:LamG domain-containing protein [Streptomyces sp. NPDC052299]|uniref:LamG domain-containing protein n=1 Tax=Streptomyces sp. NPDC052299 TaxID=3155054 RepID=UPI003425AFBF